MVTLVPSAQADGRPPGPTGATSVAGPGLPPSGPPRVTGVWLAPGSPASGWSPDRGRRVGPRVTGVGLAPDRLPRVYSRVTGLPTAGPPTSGRIALSSQHGERTYES